MPERVRQIDAFLEAAGWSGASRVPLAGDASTRRYERLALAGKPAILMDAPGQDATVAAFLRVGDWLRARGFSAPETLAMDPAAGLLLLEDFGDALLARLLVEAPEREISLCSGVIDMLVALHRHPAPDFVLPLDGPAMADLVQLTVDWYPRAIGTEPAPAAHAIPGLIARLGDELAGGARVIALRDFHAENLILLPCRTGPARFGLLDYQDAVAAHPAYDLVSLLQDARRDVLPGTEAAMLARYLDQTGRDRPAFAAAYALIGAQRQLRIIGVFARLCLHFGKPGYLAHLPRVWAYLERNLSHPALAELAAAIADGLPAPTATRIQRIKDRCGTYPHP